MNRVSVRGSGLGVEDTEDVNELPGANVITLLCCMTVEKAEDIGRFLVGNIVQQGLC